MKKTVLFAALAAIMVLGVAGAAFADIVAYPGALVAGAQKATNSLDPVEVKASVNPKITLTVNTPDAAQAVDFGAVDPGTTTGGKAVTLTVDSNKQFDLTCGEDITGLLGEITLNRDLGNSLNHVKGSAISFTDNYSIVVPVDADPTTYSAFVTYSVVQD